jgi:hypothetical protein
MRFANIYFRAGAVIVFLSKTVPSSRPFPAAAKRRCCKSLNDRDQQCYKRRRDQNKFDRGRAVLAAGNFLRRLWRRLCPVSDAEVTKQVSLMRQVRRSRHDLE